MPGKQGRGGQPKDGRDVPSKERTPRSPVRQQPLPNTGNDWTVNCRELKSWCSFLCPRMMSAVIGFITLGFWIRREARIPHPHHHSLHHGTIMFLHLFGVLPNSAPKLRQLCRIFGLERQSRTVLNLLGCDRKRHHVPVHAIV